VRLGGRGGGDGTGEAFVGVGLFSDHVEGLVVGEW